MDSKENGLGEDPHNNHPNLPLIRAKKEESKDENRNEEPVDYYGEGMDAESRIDHLKERLIECEERARTAEQELDIVAMTHMNMMKKTMNDSDRLLNASKKKLEESEKTREKLEKSLKKDKEEREELLEKEKEERNSMIEETKQREAELKKENDDLKRELEESKKTREKLGESLNREKMEREREVEETKKRDAKLKKGNGILQDRLNKLTEREKSLHLSLAETISKLGESESRSAQLNNELVEQRKRCDEEEKRLKDLIERTEMGLEITNNELVEERKRSDMEEMRLKDLIKQIEKELEKTQIKAAESRMKMVKLNVDLEEMRNNNRFLAGTPSSMVNEELNKARKKIEHLEKEVFTPKRSNVLPNKRKRTEEHPLLSDDSNENEDWDNESTMTARYFPPSDSEEEPDEAIADTTRAIGAKNKAINNDIMMEDDLMEGENEKEKKSSGNRSKIDDSDEDFKPPVKKSRSLSVRRASSLKMNATELECPECDYISLSVGSWINHLRDKHSTTPSLAGLAFLCECGHEFASNSHWGKCPRNIKIIRKRDGPIRRIDDAKTTPQCILCETYPKSALGYISHLARYHNSNLKVNGIDFLKCGCGLEVHSNNDRDHSNECDHLEFSIHKLDKK